MHRDMTGLPCRERGRVSKRPGQDNAAAEKSKADPGRGPSPAVESANDSRTVGIDLMPPPSSVTTWLQRLRAGDTAAAQVLWQRYYTDLVRLAHAHLAACVRRTVDAEDIALSAFAS